MRLSSDVFSVALQILFILSVRGPLSYGQMPTQCESRLMK